ncbi:MAG: hypothetical protein PWQ29_346 [Verrucomicrobiota bacterium]|jgi:HSP20 family molecular chaperone IbpA|nr:hypothetical protein [Verrucomicrobiota bacterium]
MNKNEAVKRNPTETAEPVENRPVFVPDTDIYEKENSILVRCDMPGVDSSGMEITLDDHVLTITGSQGRYQPEGFDQVLEEYGTGVYRRSFTMSREIDEAGITARIRNGVLEVELPKAADARPRRIAVEVAD